MFCEISGGQFSGGKVVSFQAEETSIAFIREYRYPINTGGSNEIGILRVFDFVSGSHVVFLSLMLRYNIIS